MKEREGGHVPGPSISPRYRAESQHLSHWHPHSLSVILALTVLTIPLQAQE